MLYTPSILNVESSKMTDKQAKDTDLKDWNANTHYQSSDVAEGYDAVRFSSLAGRVFSGWEQSTIVKCFSDLAPGSRIVDIPCGTGRLAEPLLKAGYKVHGMDISQEMLQVAHNRLRSFGDAFSSEVGNAKEMNKSHEQYDAVLCARVLMHFKLEEQIEFLKGVAQLTSGIVVFNQSLSSPYQRTRRGLKKILGHQESARYPVTNAEIKTLLAGASLRQVRRYRLNSIVSEAVYVVCEPI